MPRCGSERARLGWRWAPVRDSPVRFHLMPAAAAANWDAAFTVECFKLEALAAKAARRQLELDQVREVPLVHVASDLALAAAHAGNLFMLCLRQFAFPHNALMLFACTLDAIFKLPPIVRKLLGHGVGPARHIATDCGPDVHGLTNLEFMRRHWTSHVWPAHRAVVPQLEFLMYARPSRARRLGPRLHCALLTACRDREDPLRNWARVGVLINFCYLQTVASHDMYPCMNKADSKKNIELLPDA